MTLRTRLTRWTGRLPAWAWLVGLAAVLRLINLGAENLWYDEAFTAFMTKLTPANLWVALLGNDHPQIGRAHV